MDFSFKPKLSKDFILSCVSEEEIMSKYLGIPIKKKLFRSPLRNDKRPTCSFFRNKQGSLLFKDFGINKTYSCFDVVKEMFDCNFWEALKIIAKDFKIFDSDTVYLRKAKTNIEKKDNKPCKIQVEIQEFTDKELRWWSKFGINYTTLLYYDVYSCKHIFVNDNLIAKSTDSQPIFGYYGKKWQGIELWRCYFPKRKSYRFLSNWSAKKIQGYDQLPKKGDIVVITKSMKDCMCLYEFGIPACAPCSETLFVSNIILDDLKKRFKHIVVFYDTDSAGLSNMIKIRKQHPELRYVFIPRMYKSKDISDFYKDHGKEKTKKLIDDYVLWLKSSKS